MKSLPQALNDEDIVAGLRSHDENERRRAIDALFPDESAVLLKIGAMSTHIATTSRCNAAGCFAALLFTAQQFGKLLGLALAWIPETESVLEIAPGQMLK